MLYIEFTFKNGNYQQKSTAVNQNNACISPNVRFLAVMGHPQFASYIENSDTL